MIPDFGVDRSLLLLYASAFVLAHLLLFVYLSVRADGASQTSSTAESATTDSDRPQHAERPDTDHESAVTCPHCDTDNEPDFRFCRNCIGELRGTASLTTQETTQQQRRSF